ncbi:hypothetical protein DPMN_031622 [Dreissena polymorpha]|uniref:Uncharacterized protein n=1 Tax=Dreissena polymorpha TaxID=45954 RepID=A0A9D4RJA1_DREPO|nr:hypothetical protein DPMN_031622 [Dreissena polymorpha]
MHIRDNPFPMGRPVQTAHAHQGQPFPHGQASAYHTCASGTTLSPWADQCRPHMRIRDNPFPMGRPVQTAHAHQGQPFPHGQTSADRTCTSGTTLSPWADQCRPHMHIRDNPFPMGRPVQTAHAHQGQPFPHGQTSADRTCTSGTTLSPWAGQCIPHMHIRDNPFPMGRPVHTTHAHQGQPFPHGQTSADHTCASGTTLSPWADQCRPHMHIRDNPFPMGRPVQTAHAHQGQPFPHGQTSADRTCTSGGTTLSPWAGQCRPHMHIRDNPFPMGRPVQTTHAHQGQPFPHGQTSADRTCTSGTTLSSWAGQCRPHMHIRVNPFPMGRPVQTAHAHQGQPFPHGQADRTCTSGTTLSPWADQCRPHMHIRDNPFHMGRPVQTAHAHQGQPFPHGQADRTCTSGTTLSPWADQCRPHMHIRDNPFPMGRPVQTTHAHQGQPFPHGQTSADCTCTSGTTLSPWAGQRRLHMRIRDNRFPMGRPVQTTHAHQGQPFLHGQTSADRTCTSGTTLSPWADQCRPHMRIRDNPFPMGSADHTCASGTTLSPWAGQCRPHMHIRDNPFPMGRPVQTTHAHQGQPFPHGQTSADHTRTSGTTLSPWADQCRPHMHIRDNPFPMGRPVQTAHAHQGQPFPHGQDFG